MLYIVRHGETDWNKEGRCQGHSNIPLNEQGRNQAREVREKLKNVNFDVVFCSPLDRTIETARIITDGKIITDDRIIERNNGILEGKKKVEIKEIQSKPDYKDEDYNVETPEELQIRANIFLDDILPKYKGKNILIVTHGGITVNLRSYLDGPTDDIREYVLNNCEVYTYNNE